MVTTRNMVIKKIFKNIKKNMIYKKNIELSKNLYKNNMLVIYIE